MWVHEKLKYIVEAAIQVGGKAIILPYGGSYKEWSRDRYKYAKLASDSDIICVSDDDILLAPMTNKLYKDQTISWWKDYVLEQFKNIPEMGAASPVVRPERHPGDYTIKSPTTTDKLRGVVFVRRECIDDELYEGDHLPFYGRDFTTQVKQLGADARIMPRLEAFHIGWGQSVLPQVSPQQFDPQAWKEHLGN